MSFSYLENTGVKTIGLILIFLVVLTFIFLLFAPTILATSWGRTKVISAVNTQIKGTVNVKSVDVNWFGNQVIKGLTLKNPEGQIILEAQELKIETSLLHLIRDFFTGSITLKLTGEVQVLKQPGQINLHAHLQKGILTLVEPFEAVFTMTPELGQYVLQDLVPLLGGVVSAEDKVTLTINPKGFSYSLQNKDFHSAEIGLMTLNLGKMIFSGNTGELGSIMSLLKTDPSETISVWFTPIYLDMHHSKIQLQRFDMLVLNKYPLAAWGTVDFLKDRIHLIVGIPEKSLVNLIKVSLKSDQYMLQLPFKGRIGHASIDKTKLAAQIAALVSASSGTFQGKGLGALIDFAAKALKDSDPPAPTTHPFPWDSKNN